MNWVLMEGAVLAAAAVGIGVAAIIVAAVLRRRLENGWRASQDQRDKLYDRLKLQGTLVRDFIETVDHRLGSERESLEILRRRQIEVGAGRTPPEKAAALIELNNHLERLISVADADPGLSGLSEYEALREDMELALNDIGRAAATYNDLADAYNKRAAGFFGGMVGALRAERFDASQKKRPGFSRTA